MSEAEPQPKGNPEPNWYQHKPFERRGDYCLTVDFVDVDEPPLNNPNGEYMIHVCPSCGSSISAYHSGYCTMADNFKECLCAECFTALFRHIGIVVTETVYNNQSDYFTVEKMQQYLKNRADRRFWFGELARVDAAMLHGMETPPTPILGVKDNINKIVGDWEPRCPCCGVLESSDVDFDFHHWDYEDDIGCKLCRDCHSHIHDDMRATQQDQKHEHYGWKAEAIVKLYNRSKAHGLRFDNAEEFFERFNVEAADNLRLNMSHKIRRENDE